MADLTKNTDREYKSTGKEYIEHYPVKANIHIFVGMMVALDQSGSLALATLPADTADFLFGGIAVEEANNTGGANGDKTVALKIDALIWIPDGGASVGNIGFPCFASDSDTISVSTPINVSGQGKIINAVANEKHLIDFSKQILSF